jgi:predicted DNA-binding antitoxin AbrB/MazE fold protein
MTKQVGAIYEKGILRPLGPLSLQERQRVSLTIIESETDPADAWLDHEYLAAVDAVQEPDPSLEEVRHALSKIPGNLSDDVRAERDSRG